MNLAEINSFTKKLGSLECTIVDTPNEKDHLDALVVLCHGFGAPGDDLVPCANELFGSVDGLTSVRFVFPIAPIELDPSGFYDSRAWWPIDVLKLQEMIEKGELRDLREDRPELLDERFAQLVETIETAKQDAGVNNGRLVIGGFSQGSMLTTEVALRMDEPPAGLIVWSGALLSETKWRFYAGQRGQLRIIQSHGRQDPILPFVGGQWLHELFAENHFDAKFLPFNGPHTISREGLVEASRLISSVARD